MLVWLLSRVFSFSQLVPWSYWEVAEARKLLDYGFFERKGALMHNQFMSGIVPDPEVFNYVNHPYPIHWLNTFLYFLWGGTGIIAFNAGIGLASSLLTFLVLRSHFDSKSSWIGTCLYILAPSSIFFDADPNVVAMGACIWPILISLVSLELRSFFSPRTPPSLPLVRGGERWGRWKSQIKISVVLGIVIFIGGQISWFTLSVLPSLFIILYLSKKTDLIERNEAKTYSTALLLGAFATLGVFVCQILYYTPKFEDLFIYLSQQVGADSTSQSRWQLFSGILIRTVVLVGPALWVGCCLGVWMYQKERVSHPFAVGMMAYFIVFALGGVILARFYFRERTMYEYLLFPAAYLATYAIHKKKFSFVVGLFLALSIPGVMYAQLRASIPQVSVASRTIGNFISQHTKPNEIVLTNLREQSFPFPNWDVGSHSYTMMAADRLIRFDIQDWSSIQKIYKDFSWRESPPIFLLDLSKEISEELRHQLETKGVLVTRQTFTIPKEPSTFATKARTFYWKFLGRQAPSQPDPARTEVTFELYRFQLEG